MSGCYSNTLLATLYVEPSSLFNGHYTRVLTKSIIRNRRGRLHGDKYTADGPNGHSTADNIQLSRIGGATTAVKRNHSEKRRDSLIDGAGTFSMTGVNVTRDVVREDDAHVVVSVVFHVLFYIVDLSNWGLLSYFSLQTMIPHDLIQSLQHDGVLIQSERKIYSDRGTVVSGHSDGGYM